jgi:hypothetical protein
MPSRLGEVRDRPVMSGVAVAIEAYPWRGFPHASHEEFPPHSSTSSAGGSGGDRSSLASPMNTRPRERSANLQVNIPILFLGGTCRRELFPCSAPKLSQGSHLEVRLRGKRCTWVWGAETEFVMRTCRFSAPGRRLPGILTRGGDWSRESPIAITNSGGRKAGECLKGVKTLPRGRELR